MFVGLQVTSPPEAEPVTVQLAAQHLRVDQTNDNDLLAIYIPVAREQAEGYLGRALITQTIQQTIGPEVPFKPDAYWQRAKGPFTLLRAPVQSIESVTALDVYGNTTTIPAGNYAVSPAVLGYQIDLSQEPARLWIDPQFVMATSGDGIGGATFDTTPLQNVQITFVAGYGADSTKVPNSIINAILFHVAFLYEHRGDDGGEMPAAIQNLLNRYRLHFFA